jgi:hypothetical protein
MPTCWLESGQSHSYSVIASIAERRPYHDYLRPATDYRPLTHGSSRSTASAAAARSSSLQGGREGRLPAGADQHGQARRALQRLQMVEAGREPADARRDPDAELVKECKKGWVERFSKPVLAHQPTQQELTSTYLPRLQFELDTLKRLGFAQYFLLVQDLVQWSKQNGIYVGPGRGSVGGSLVAYLMGITDVDPIRFDLLFERFINPDRLDLPDADLDFMSTRREEVVDYLVRRWGADKVAGIVNYNTMGARSALRDIGKIFGVDAGKITHFIGDTHGVGQAGSKKRASLAGARRVRQAPIPACGCTRDPRREDARLRHPRRGHRRRRYADRRARRDREAQRCARHQLGQADQRRAGPHQARRARPLHARYVRPGDQADLRPP